MNNKTKSGKHDTVLAFINPIPFPDEITHLAMINEILDGEVQAATDNVGKTDKDYMDAKRYMADYRGEIDPHEMFQNELALKQIDRTGAFLVGVWEKLSKLKESPYFARIDFHQEDGTQPTKNYIGRFSFTHKIELLIFDWRAPIASMFYDCEVGPAGYDAPMGRVEGHLTRKRQFKVKNGELEYACFKSTLDFVWLMEQFAAEVPALIFKPVDYAFGRFSVSADWIRSRFCSYQSYPIKKRLVLIADDIHDRFTRKMLWMMIFQG